MTRSGKGCYTSLAIEGSFRRPGGRWVRIRDLIRLAAESDAEQMLAIYAPIVRETAISFELEPPPLDEFWARVRGTLERTPWLVCASDEEVLGYAYAGRYRPRAAYQWSVEVTVYVDGRHRGRGVGRALYTSLFECLRVQGYQSAYAAIALPNPASVALHERLGFELIGVYHAVGYKLGSWHDVGWWQLSIGEHLESPAEPKPLLEVQHSAEWRQALSSGERWLKKA